MVGSEVYAGLPPPSTLRGSLDPTAELAVVRLRRTLGFDANTNRIAWLGQALRDLGFQRSQRIDTGPTAPAAEKNSWATWRLAVRKPTIQYRLQHIIPDLSYD